ncbi:uncharacterized protein K452DRAFT_295834 [Aplosporella prunicola CBS 121167]|uniref:Uncharacterized protein n=1 Tax=Aplosporella prunicola CBS 121167 TaxID=1176127 RepID=A0A6A6BL35_9PEZI|nr:uncharacterized protein K452DRAFT_295834 [Aplosporella prunicola CBS 121167]KAF2144378.1 hypothetical protein K452DRAFT_295834 [Aplosporella prunicola CBS 121167]
MFTLSTSPHPQRAALLNGPTVDVVVPFASCADLTHTVPAVPRQLLFACAREAALQLRASADVVPLGLGIEVGFGVGMMGLGIEGFCASPTGSGSGGVGSPTVESAAGAGWGALGAAGARGSVGSVRSVGSGGSGSGMKSAAGAAGRRSVVLSSEASVSPAAVEFLLAYLRRACKEEVVPALFPGAASWRLGVQVLGAARGLGVREVEGGCVRFLRGWIGGAGEASERGERGEAGEQGGALPLSVDDVKVLVMTVGERDPLVKEVVERVRAEEAERGEGDLGAYLRENWRGVWERAGRGKQLDKKRGVAMGRKMMFRRSRPLSMPVSIKEAVVEEDEGDEAERRE